MRFSLKKYNNLDDFIRRNEIEVMSFKDCVVARWKSTRSYKKGSTRVNETWTNQLIGHNYLDLSQKLKNTLLEKFVFVPYKILIVALIFSVIFIVNVEIVLILAMSLLFWVLFILEFICNINYRKILKSDSIISKDYIKPNFFGLGSLFQDVISNNVEEVQSLLIKVMAAQMSPSFRSLYYFQFDFLPKYFYKDPISFDILIGKGGTSELIRIFKEDIKDKPEYVCLLTEENIHITEYVCSETSKILHLAIPELHKVILLQWKTPLCNNVYFYINSENPLESRYFTFENHETTTDHFIMLCSIDRYNNRTNYGEFTSENIEEQLKKIKSLCNIEMHAERSIMVDQNLIMQFDKFYLQVQEIVKEFNPLVNNIEVLTFSLIINDMKISNKPEIMYDFEYRNSIFNNIFMHYFNNENQLEQAKFIHAVYDSIISEPDKYLLGQAYAMFPVEDVKIISQLKSVPAGVMLLFFIDRIYYGIKLPSDAKIHHVRNIMDEINKAESLLLLRYKLWYAIAQYLSDTSIQEKI